MSFVVGYAIGSRRSSWSASKVQSSIAKIQAATALTCRLNFGTGTKGTNLDPSSSGAVVRVKLPNCESIASLHCSKVLVRTGFESLQLQSRQYGNWTRLSRVTFSVPVGLTQNST
jgi:hypothetical protein